MENIRKIRGFKLGNRIFGSSGVRGEANVELTPILAANVGVAIANYSKARRVLVARDTRISGETLENALISGLLACGARVNVLGISPTPVLAFLTKKLGMNVGIMITASHNPAQYNGIKVFDHGGRAFGEAGQNGIEELLTHGQQELADWRGIGYALAIDEGGRYFEAVEKKARLRRSWRVVVDPGCGAAYGLSPLVLKKSGCVVTALNAQPDGFFSARSPEPNAESLYPLAEVVKELHADVGIAYDGDADRVSFIDEHGKFADFDRTLAAYAAHAVEKNGGGVVVTSVEASMCVETMVEQAGGRVVRTRVGDIYIAEEIVKKTATFGGEPCGAWIHPQLHLCPDGILSSVLLLQALEEGECTLSEFVSKVPQYRVLRNNVYCSNNSKDAVIERVGESLKKLFPKYRDSSNVDGIRLALKDGWILVRASGTEPLIRITVEGDSTQTAAEIMSAGSKLVRRFIQETKK